MSRIEELTEEREKLRLEQLKHQKGIEECERRQLFYAVLAQSGRAPDL